MRTSTSPDATGGDGPFSRGVSALAVIVVAVILTFASQASAHGGPPLRLGVTADPSLSAIGRLVLSHLREGVGFGVDWREFGDESALRAAFAAGKIDVAVGSTGPVEALQPAVECPPETLTRLREGLGRTWGGKVFMLGFPAASSPCERPALIVAPAVLEDLRFGILGREAARLSSLVTAEDVAAVRAAAARGGERAAAGAARAAMAARARR